MRISQSPWRAISHHRGPSRTAGTCRAKSRDRANRFRRLHRSECQYTVQGILFCARTNENRTTHAVVQDSSVCLAWLITFFAGGIRTDDRAFTVEVLLWIPHVICIASKQAGEITLQLGQLLQSISYALSLALVFAVLYRSIYEMLPNFFLLWHCALRIRCTRFHIVSYNLRIA